MTKKYTYHVPTLVVGDVLRTLRYHGCKYQTGIDNNGFTEVSFTGDEIDKMAVITTWKNSIKSLSQEKD